MHVDACFGGFMLPWLERLGCKIPPFDFRVRGVTSISADVHKYGYASKGASVILYRNAELRSYQYFSYSSWPGGLFVSPSMAGSRPGGIIAATWAVMMTMGQNGYLKRAASLLETTQKIITGNINASEKRFLLAYLNVSKASRALKELRWQLNLT
jgi:sphinganine-1-phosphate aldolase